MDNGLYRATYTGPFGSGAGVVTFADGRFSGGDGALAYVGDMRQNGDEIVANLRTFRHTNNGSHSVFGQDNVQVTLRGKPTANGAVLQADGVNFTAKLERLAA